MVPLWLQQRAGIGIPYAHRMYNILFTHLPPPPPHETIYYYYCVHFGEQLASRAPILNVCAAELCLTRSSLRPAYKPVLYIRFVCNLTLLPYIPSRHFSLVRFTRVRLQ